MLSLRSTILAVATMALAGFAQAKDYQIDPETVDEGTRDRWCDDQMRICPFICEQTKPGTTEKNECWSDNLTYSCICGDGKAANVTKYSLTLPFHICQEYGNQCVTACNGDSTCQSKCREENPCGATDPDRVNITTTSSTSKPTASQSDDGTTIYTGTPGSDDGEDDAKGSKSGNGGGSGAGALNSAQAFSMAVVFGTMFAGFAML